MDAFWVVLGLLLLVERVVKYVGVNAFFSRFDLLGSCELGLAAEGVKVSILQPILSGDPTLWHCLSSNLQMQTCYEREFLWLIDMDDEVGLAGCELLKEEYPDVDVRLIVLPRSPNGISPKTFKLIEGLKVATGQMIAVLDDDTILPDRAFEQCLPLLDNPEVGVAFGLPYYRNFSSFWSSLLSGVVNGNSLFTYIPYTYLIEPFTINGMFFVSKREILEGVNGFLGLETAIVDDYAIARRFRSCGYRLAQSPVCHGISTQVRDAGHYFSILNRWFIFPQASILQSAKPLELLVFYSVAFFPTCFPLLVVVYSLLFPSIYTLIYGLVYFGVNYYILSFFNDNYLREATPKDKIFWLLAIQVLLPFNIFLSLLSPRKINWRGHIMEINKDGSFHFVQRRREVE
jgi:ceramide glucosyltransferase